MNSGAPLWLLGDRWCFVMCVCEITSILHVKKGNRN